MANMFHKFVEYGERERTIDLSKTQAKSLSAFDKIMINFQKIRFVEKNKKIVLWTIFYNCDTEMIFLTF